MKANITRKELIQLLAERPMTPSEISRTMGIGLRTAADELKHILLSLPHTEYAAEISPARCRKCGFVFGHEKLGKPTRCPACRSTWIAEPVIGMCLKSADKRKNGSSNWLETVSARGAEVEGVQLVEHTADTGLLVRAPDLAVLFGRAALGMFAVLANLRKVVPVRAARVEVEAEDLEGLLVRWLSELNYLHVTRRELYTKFDVHEVKSTLAVADIWGEPIDTERHTVYTEIKAVTFHGLRLEQSSEGWVAQVIFDL